MQGRGRLALVAGMEINEGINGPQILLNTVIGATIII